VSLPDLLVDNAPAKINLTLRILGRRADGYHELESLVAFADFGDRLGLTPGGALALKVSGPRAAQAAAGPDNLVLKAARALADSIPGLILGTFDLDKRLPVAAGIGGGSADAGAALRLLAKANGLALDDPRLHAAARATGADVPVCLDPRVRIMRGIGEILSAPIAVPPLPAVLVNPGVAVPTKAVFTGWQADGEGGTPSAPLDPIMLSKAGDADQLVHRLALATNDLEKPAIALAPVIADVLALLRAQRGCALARMSGSGATCFGLFASDPAAEGAAAALAAKHPEWWVKAVSLGSAA
jgi:4-diphosphocytidyl-2-C-methyl-D-erythritol kinase